MNAKIVGLLVAASVAMTGCAFYTQTNAGSNPSPSVSSTAKIASDKAGESHFALNTPEAVAARAATAKAKAETEAAAEAAEAARVATEAAAIEAAAIEAKRIADEEARVAAERAAYDAVVKAEREAAWVAAQKVNEEKIKADAAAQAKNEAAAAKPKTAANKTALLSGETGYQWMDRMQKLYGVYAYPGTQFFVAPSTPCNAFAPTALGCTEQHVDSVTKEPLHTHIKLHMSEAAIGNVYILFHEIAHTQGIMDECQADIYSRNVTGIPGGYYCK